MQHFAIWIWIGWWWWWCDRSEILERWIALWVVGASNDTFDGAWVGWEAVIIGREEKSNIQFFVARLNEVETQTKHTLSHSITYILLRFFYCSNEEYNVHFINIETVSLYTMWMICEKLVWQIVTCLNVRFPSESVNFCFRNFHARKKKNSSSIQSS